jgi:hypothetical protein
MYSILSFMRTALRRPWSPLALGRNQGLRARGRMRKRTSLARSVRSTRMYLRCTHMHEVWHLRRHSTCIVTCVSTTLVDAAHPYVVCMYNIRVAHAQHTHKCSIQRDKGNPIFCATFGSTIFASLLDLSFMPL